LAFTGRQCDNSAMPNILKRVIKQILASCGYELSHRRTYRAIRFRTSLRESLENAQRAGFSPATIIDVGVGNGTIGLYDAFPSAHYLFIEPLLEHEESVKALCAERHGDYVLAGAATVSGTRTIHVHTKELEGSSMLEEVDGQEYDGEVRTIPVVTVDEVCERFGARGPYLLKVDVQGAELDVLGGAAKTLRDTELIFLEVSLFNFQHGTPDFTDVIVALRDLGFVAYDIFSMHNRPYDGALGQIDIAFVKKEGMLRRYHGWRPR